MTWKSLRTLGLVWVIFGAPLLWGQAESSASGATQPAATSDAALRTQAAAAVQGGYVQPPRTPDFLEHMVDLVLGAFDLRTGENTAAHFGVAALILVIALFARRIVTRVIFALLRKVASKTRTTFDDRLFLALETPVATFVMIVGIIAALKVLKLTAAADIYVSNGSRVAIALVIFWALWRALSTALDHAQDVSRERGLSVAAFMPWVKKTLLTVFAVMAVLLTMQTMGYDVKAILAGLGIGGLAFALAAQDTLANIFGAIVVAIDQPFKIGEAVRIGGNVGGVEDIGLRSTRIRLVDKSLMVVPNKIVAAETITNFSRFTRRRVEQIIGLSHGTTPEQIEAMLQEIRGIVLSHPEVDKNSLMLFFRDITPSSLELWMVYEFPNPDFIKHMNVKQQINLEIMRRVSARGLRFAHPIQEVRVAGELAEKLMEEKAREASEPPPPQPGA